MVGENIPALKYLTRIDYFVYSVFFFIFLNAVECFFIFEAVDDEDDQKSIADTCTMINSKQLLHIIVER